MLVKFIKHQDWIHMFKAPIPIVQEKEVKDFYYSIKFSKDGLSLATMVKVEIFLDELTLGEILHIPINVIRSVKN